MSTVEVRVSTTERDLATIGGWLLVFCIALVPHIILSSLILSRYLPLVTSSVDLSAVEWLRIVTQAHVLIGSLVGIALVLRRNRFTPAYWLAYLVSGTLLIILDPDLIATQVAHEQLLGFANPGEDVSASLRVARVRTVISFTITAILCAYWVKSKRVRAVFGSTGFQALRRNWR